MSKTLVIHNGQGRILRTVTGGYPAPELLVQPGETGLEFQNVGRVTVDSHYVVGQQIMPFPARPSPAHKWDFQLLTWVLDLTAAKDEKWGAMKEARRAAIEAPLATPHGTFDADIESRNNIIQTAHLMQTEAQSLAPESEPTVDFTLADNSVVTLTAGQMVEVALLLAAQIQVAYARGRAVRAAIEAATTQAEIAAVSWAG